VPQIIAVGSHNPTWKSDSKTFSPGQTVDLYDFVPIVGPNGGRVCIDTLELVITGTITVGTGAWDGRDVARLAALIQAEKRDSRMRWVLSGYKSRLASFYLNGPEEYLEHAQVAVGAGQAVNLRIPIPLAKKYIRRPTEFSLPADSFKKLTIACAQLASAQTGSAVLSAQNLVVYSLAEWHEEMDIEFKCDDIVKSLDYVSATQVKTSLSGALHDAFACKEDTTAGGASVTGFTDARIEDLGTPTLTNADLVASYRKKRGLAPTGPTTPATERFLDPVIQGSTFPIMAATYRTSPWDGRLLDSAKIDHSAGVSGAALVTREVLGKSEANFKDTVARWKVDRKTIGLSTTDGGRVPLNSKTKRHIVAGALKASSPLMRKAG